MIRWIVVASLSLVFSHSLTSKAHGSGETPVKLFSKGPKMACSSHRTSEPNAFLTAEEKAFIVIINNYRKQYGLQPVKPSFCLTAAAQWLNYDMGTKWYFDHGDSLGRRAAARVQDFGVPHFSGENIGAGYVKAQDIFIGWKNSPGHNKNMLSKYHKYIGVSRTYVPNSKHGYYWTTDFSYQ